MSRRLLGAHGRCILRPPSRGRRMLFPLQENILETEVTAAAV
jgi:hypothetical protein